MMSAVWTLAQIQDLLRPLLGEIACFGVPDLPLTRVHTDSRSVQTGDLFVALKGERFDGHDFLTQVAATPGCAVLAERGFVGEDAVAGLQGLWVADSKKALMALAQAWRAAWGGPLIAVAGSNGKTTVTQMIASILRAQFGSAAHATRGNFNNDIGVPLTLLGLRREHQIAVVELGMNHPGEIAQLASMAAPSVALVNNAQHEHMEFMKSVAAVAAENGAVLSSLPPEGVAVFPHDEDYSEDWYALAGSRRTLTFGTEPATRAPKLHDQTLTGHGQWQQGGWRISTVLRAADQSASQEWTLRLNMAGSHNVRNALAAVAATTAAAISREAIAQGLAQFEPMPGRSRSLALAGGRALIDDSYNANPDSVLAAIAMLASLPGPHALVLGDMGEVGEEGPRFHREVVAAARQAGIAHLVLHGPLCQHAAQHHGLNACEPIEAVIDQALRLQTQVQTTLVKGSRFMRMERVVQAMQDADATATIQRDTSNKETSAC